MINSNGWSKGNFYVRASITDNSGSGIKSAKSCTSNSSSECTPVTNFSGTSKDFYVETEGSNRLCIEVTDNNNKTTKICSDTYKLDKTAPVVGTATFSGTLGSNNWYTSNVTVKVNNGSDSLSGHSSTTSNVSSITTNSTGTTVIITTTDQAGNTATKSYSIKLDKNSPSITAKNSSVTVVKGDSNSISNYFTISYSTSGGSTSCNYTNTSTLNLGTYTATCTVTGKNGKTAKANVTIYVKTHFEMDSWTTIANNIRAGNTDMYNVGDEKELEMRNYGRFTVRIANMSTPTECNNSNFSQTACGFVIEFVDILEQRNFNGIALNDYGWPESALMTYLNGDFYDLLPEDLKDVIIQTKTISGPGSSYSSVYTDYDYIYLFSHREVLGNYIEQADLSFEYTRQLDFYQLSDSSPIKMFYYAPESYSWWLRSAAKYDNKSFLYITSTGDLNYAYANESLGISPAFRIG